MFQIIDSITSKVSDQLPDKRLDNRYNKINTSLKDHQSSVMNQVSINRAERKGGYDFFKNKRVSELVLQQKVYGRLARSESKIKDTHLLVLADTTEYNYASNRNRLGDLSGLGTLSNEHGLGYFAHINLALDATDLSVVGLSDMQIWHRKEDRPGAQTRKLRKFEDKESYKWYVGSFNSHQRLQSANQVTYVQDRDGDAYESISRIKEMEGAQLLVRNCKDRKIELDSNEQSMLYQYLDNQPVLFSYELAVRGDQRKRRRSRVAQLDVRCVRVKLVCPKKLRQNNPVYSEVDVIWVKERASSVLPLEKAIDWKLLTTHEVEGKQSLIMETINWYANRWIIEEFFLSRRQEGMILKMLYWKLGMVCVN